MKHIELGTHSYTGKHVLYFYDAGVRVGNYTGIANEVTFCGKMNYPWLFERSVNLVPWPKTFRAGRQVGVSRGDIEIGSDCWIGFRSTILDGVKIGNGCIVGLGSVVTKDVPDYAIVAGNPAKIVKYRYSPDIIKQLLKIRWWDWGHRKIIANKKLFKDINAFLEKHAL